MHFPEGLEDSPFKLKVLKYQWNFRPHCHIKIGETPNNYQLKQGFLKNLQTFIMKASNLRLWTSQLVFRRHVVKKGKEFGRFFSIKVANLKYSKIRSFHPVCSSLNHYWPLLFSLVLKIGTKISFLGNWCIWFLIPRYSFFLQLPLIWRRTSVKNRK